MPTLENRKPLFRLCMTSFLVGGVMWMMWNVYQHTQGCAGDAETKMGGDVPTSSLSTLPGGDVPTSDHSRKQYNTVKNREDTIDHKTALAFLQKYTQKIANGPVPSSVNPMDHSTFTEWYQAAAIIDLYQKSKPRYPCKNLVKTGKSDWGICQDKEVEVKPPCLVYDFGINYQWEFADYMGKLGCEVHCFDPSMKKAKDHRRSANITFHKIGLGANNVNTFSPRTDGYTVKGDIWKIRTLKRIIEMLGHQKRLIDVVKMDVESYEWQAVDNMLETGVLPQVRHFLVEWHLFNDWPRREEYHNLLHTITKLRDIGFHDYYQFPHLSQEKVTKDHYNLQCDSYYINTMLLDPL